MIEKSVHIEGIKVKPFLKWAGGKRWFADKYSHLIPQHYNRYIEPFLGSGAVFFHINAEHAILGDSNLELIETYNAIRLNWKLVYRYLKEHHSKHSKEYYYKIRNFKPRSLASKAARFIYLNRTCWNGLYRVNRKGRFNVPIGTRSTVVREDDCFDKISEKLQNAELYNCDFEELIDIAGDGDLVFVDPPYTVRHNNNGFIKYNEDLFSWDDQKRLVQSLCAAKARGATIIGTNAHHECVLELYQDNFSTFSAMRNSSISSNINNRKNYEELIIYAGVNDDRRHRRRRFSQRLNIKTTP